MKNNNYLLQIFEPLISALKPITLEIGGGGGPTVPTLFMNAPTNITLNSADCEAYGVTFGTGPVNQGFCWSNQGSPSVLNSSTNLGTTNTTFAQTISGLLPNNTYYVRDWAQNAAGVGYSAPQQIRTPELIIQKAIVIGGKTMVAGSQRLKFEQNQSFKDWFLPSAQEAQHLRDHVASISNLSYVWTSTETDTYNAGALQVYNGAVVSRAKTENNSVMAVRKFVSSDIYTIIGLGPQGPAGGTIFHSIDNGNGTFTYYEAAPRAFALTPWSNITDALVSGTSYNMGYGTSNTNLIIAQAGHISSAAKQCKDLSN
jgi:hypothetical protein